MKPLHLLFSFCTSLLLLCVYSVSAQQTQTLQDHGVYFVKNSGQIIDEAGGKRPQILYTAEAGDVNIFFTTQSISYVFSEKVERMLKSRKHPDSKVKKEKKEEKLNIHRVDMQLIGSNTNVEIIGDEQAEYQCNYYLPHCQDGLTHVSVYRKLIYKNVYNNIDLVFYSHEGRVKYDFIVRPGGNASDIRFRYSGAKSIELTSDGKLNVETTLGRLEEYKPVSFRKKKNQGGKQDVQSSFNIANGEIRFNVGAYDSGDTLVLDPEVKLSTYIGGSSTDAAEDVAIDSKGNIIIRGRTKSSNFPVSTSASQTTLSGVDDTFIVKMTPTGMRLWATYFGGGASEEGLVTGGLAIDHNDNILITGSTKSDSSSFPETVGAFQRKRNGQTDAYVAKFSSTGTLVWATYYGGSQIDEGDGIAVDSDNNVLVSGETISSNFPVSPGAFQTSILGSNSDGFIVKFNSNGQRLWATYFGGSGAAYELMYDIQADNNNNIIVVGTGASGFPVTSTASQTTFGGVRDAVVAKFSTSGSRIWATYLGGTGEESAYRAAVDSDNNIVVVGFTGSTSASFPITTTAVQTTFGGGGYDGFVTKFSSSGSRIWSSFYGGSQSDEMYGVALDGSNNIYIAGSSASTNLSVTADAVKATLSGSYDAFALKLDKNGKRSWCTYFGGTSSDNGSAIAVDPSGVAYLAGYTTSTNLTITTNAMQSTYGGSTDAFVAKIVPCGYSDPIVGTRLPINFCSTGDGVILDVGEYDHYLWSTGATTRIIIATMDGDYWVTVWNEGGCPTTSKIITIDIP